MLKMSTSTECDGAIEQEADDIASKMIGILVEKFKDKEGRDPGPEEVEQLLEELTEERVTELLGMDVQEEAKIETQPTPKFSFTIPAKTATTTDSTPATTPSVTTPSTGNNSSSSITSETDAAINPSPSQEADDIASGILDILMKKFKDKTGEDPTDDDVAKMLEEMTEERVAELLAGVEAGIEQDDKQILKRKQCDVDLSPDDPKKHKSNVSC